MLKEPDSRIMPVFHGHTLLTGEAGVARLAVTAEAKGAILASSSVLTGVRLTLVLI